MFLWRPKLALSWGQSGRSCHPHSVYLPRVPTHALKLKTCSFQTNTSIVKARTPSALLVPSSLFCCSRLENGSEKDSSCMQGVKTRRVHRYCFARSRGAAALASLVCSPVRLSKHESTSHW